MSLAWLAILVLAIAAAAMLAIGLRGRRISDHPVCRRCRFDLVGTLPQHDHCPECGSSLTAPGAVRAGLRRRRWLPIGAAGVLMLGAASLGLLQAAGADLNRHKPTWWLIHIDLRRDDPVALEAAVAELLDRLASGAVGAADLKPAASALLARQSQTHRPWFPVLGDLFEDLWSAGVLTESQTLEYMQNSITPELHIHESFEASTVRYSVRWQRSRIGSLIRHTIPFIIAPERCILITPDGELELQPPRSGEMACTYSARPNGWTTEHAAADVPPGRYPLRIDVRLRCDYGLPIVPEPGMSGIFQLDHPPERRQAPFVEWVSQLQGDVTILADSVPVFELTMDPALRGAVRSAIQLNPMLITPPDSNGRVWISGCIAVAELPVGIEHDLVIRQHGREIRIHQQVSSHAPPMDRPAWVQPPPPMRSCPTVSVPLQPGAFEFVLRPAPTVRRWASDYERTRKPIPVWGEEIILHAQVPEPPAQ